MTKINRLGPLMARQFRVLRAFAVVNVLVVGWFLWTHWIQIDAVANELWSGAVLMNLGWSGMAMVFAWEAPYCLATLAVLTLLMAAWQQIDAHHMRSAQLMASMPVTRGRMLQAQLLSGLAVIALSMALYAAGCSALSAHYREIYELGALASPIPGQLLSQIGPHVPLLLALRLFMTLVSGYLGASVLLGLFGNPLISFGFVVGAGLCGLVWLRSGGLVSQKLHQLGVLPDVRFSRVFELAGIGLPGFRWMRPYAHTNYVMPWDALAPFIAVHLTLWAASLLILWQQKKHLALERLGGFFLFPASRWAVIGLLMLCLLPLPLMCLSVWNADAQVFQFNPSSLFWLATMAVVFMVSYWRLIRRPKLRLNRQLAALVLALLFVGSSARAAELNIEPEVFAYYPDDMRIGWRYDADMLEVDAPWAERVTQVFEKIVTTLYEHRKNQSGPEQAVEEPEIHEEYSFDGQPWISGHDDAESDPLSFEHCTQTLSNYHEAVMRFDVSPVYISEQELSGALKQCGFAELATQYVLRTATKEKAGMAHQDGLWLEWRRTPDVEHYVNAGGLTVWLYANTPITLKDGAQIDEMVLKNPDARRAYCYTNGITGTLVYEFYGEGEGVSRASGGFVTGTVMLKDGKPWRLMLSAPSVEYPQLREVAKRAAESMAEAVGAELTGEIERWAGSTEVHWLARLE